MVRKPDVVCISSIYRDFISLRTERGHPAVLDGRIQAEVEAFMRSMTFTGIR